jgi:lipopolysaccharide/colanic/teichoic acid biosynthesis glycosyltransferase
LIENLTSLSRDLEREEKVNRAPPRFKIPAEQVSNSSLDEFNQRRAASYLAGSGRVTKGGSLYMNSLASIVHIGTAVPMVSEPKVPRWKSALDVICILVSLPLWLPMMLLLMLVTRIASTGPVFYRQRRVGLGGKHFSIWKLRTMKVNSETHTHEHYFEALMRADCAMTKLDTRGDPRLAPFGRILRASGLDELPQIFNVLCGEMSLVGPRPCLPNEFAKYEPWQRQRVNTLPGLTGLWQVSGKNKTTFNEMIRMDLSYLKNMSMVLDLQIMFKTGTAIVRELFEVHQGASQNGQDQIA